RARNEQPDTRSLTAAALTLRHHFKIFDLRNMRTQLLLDAVDDRHDRCGAAAADTAQADLGHAVADAEHLDQRAVHCQRGADLLGQPPGETLLQFCGHSLSLAKPVSPCSPAGPAPRLAATGPPIRRRCGTAACRAGGR